MTRAEAKAAGQRHYDEGKTCPRGHLPVFRLVSTGCCLICHRLDSAKYYADDPEKMRERSREWARKHPDTTRNRDAAYRKANRDKRFTYNVAYRAAHRVENIAYCAAWRAANRPKYLADAIAYSLANRAKRCAIQAKRRARKAGSNGVYTDADIAIMLKRQRGKCAHSWCRKPLSTGYHVDHIVPLALGGSNYPRNLQALCPPCNRIKHDSHPVDFAQRNGMLL